MRDRGDGGKANDEIDTLFTALSTMSPLLAYTGSVERSADEIVRLEGELAWARKSLAQSERTLDSWFMSSEERARLRTDVDLLRDTIRTLEQERAKRMG